MILIDYCNSNFCVKSNSYLILDSPTEEARKPKSDNYLKLRLETFIYKYTFYNSETD